MALAKKVFFISRLVIFTGSRKPVLCEGRTCAEWLLHTTDQLVVMANILHKHAACITAWGLFDAVGLSVLWSTAMSCHNN